MSELAPCIKTLLQAQESDLTEEQNLYLAEHDLGAVFSCDRTTGEHANIACLALIFANGAVGPKTRCLLDSNEYAWQEELAGRRLAPNEVLWRVMSRDGYKSVKKRP